MRVDVQREACRGVPQQALHGFDVRAAGNGDGRGGVPQIVRASVRPPHFLQQSLEALVEGGHGAVLTLVRSKYEVVFIIPFRTGCKLVDELSPLLALEVPEGRVAVQR